MNLNLKSLFKAVGFLMIIISLSMLAPAFVCLYYGEYATLESFLLVILPNFMTGTIMFLNLSPSNTRLTMRDGFLIVSLCWLVASLMGALPFWLSKVTPDFMDAFFESTSGFTTTGSTILSHLENLPKGLLFWRSMTHWFGGMGILIFAISVLPSMGIGGNLLASTEAPGPTMEKITAKISDTAKLLYFIYALFTLAEIILLFLFGMPLFDSINTAFSTMGTGGFALFDDSIAHYHSVALEMIITLFMVMAGVNFNLYFFAVRKRGKLLNLVEDEEFRLYIMIITTVSILIALNLWDTGFYNTLHTSLRSSVFQVASIISTTGFATVNYDMWPTFSKMLLFFLMFIGGCSSSTGGGVKVARIMILLKLIKRGLQVKLHPNAIISIKVKDRKLTIDSVSAVANFMFLHIFVVALSTLLVSLDGHDIITSISAVLASVGNIGPGFNLVGPSMNFALFSKPITLLFTMLMIAGRLELYSFLMIFLPVFWRNDR